MTAEVDTMEANENADQDANEDEGNRTFTARSFVYEQQRLMVPATSDQGSKLKDFHDQIVELSKS